jgi:hypothetical protein
VGFVVDKVALVQVFLQVLRFPLPMSFHRGSSYSYIVWRMNNRPVGGRSAHSKSHSIDMIENKVAVKYFLFLLH